MVLLWEHSNMDFWVYLGSGKTAGKALTGYKSRSTHAPHTHIGLPQPPEYLHHGSGQSFPLCPIIRHGWSTVGAAQWHLLWHSLLVHFFSCLLLLFFHLSCVPADNNLSPFSLSFCHAGSCLTLASHFIFVSLLSSHWVHHASGNLPACLPSWQSSIHPISPCLSSLLPAAGLLT